MSFNNLLIEGSWIQQDERKSFFCGIKSMLQILIYTSSVNQMMSSALLSCTSGEYSHYTCEAVDVIRLCCHAAVLWQCQMNFCTPIPRLVFKLARRPCPFLWACGLLGNTSISCGCDAVCLPFGAEWPHCPSSSVRRMLMSCSWTSAILVIKEHWAISTRIFLSQSTCPRSLCFSLFLPQCSVSLFSHLEYHCSATLLSPRVALRPRIGHLHTNTTHKTCKTITNGACVNSNAFIILISNHGPSSYVPVPSITVERVAGPQVEKLTN